MIPPATLEQIRNASDIVDVIGAVLPLKRRGASFLALCPFHKEKTPSFNVHPQRQIFYCFGCHKGGDVITFIREYENLSFVEAVKRLADRAGIAIELDRTDAGQQTRLLKDKLLQIHEQVAARWHTALQNDAAGQIARDYLAQRGVSAEAVQLFRLGYAPDAWDDTVNWGRSKDFEPVLLEQAGLVLRHQESGRYYDRFRGRLMFPIGDEQGRVIAFSGRVLKPEDQGGKYVNSPETPIFKKGRVFYGLDKSKRAILDAGHAVVCEGQLDLIACYMAGVKNIVAPQGTAFTADHARILKRYTDEIVLCFDSDTAGQNAAVRLLDDLLASGLAIRVAAMPAPHDPDSFIKANGGEAFQQLIASAAGFFDFYLDLLCRTHDVRTDKGRLGVLHEMAAGVHKTGSAVLLDTYAQKTAQRLAVAPEAVRAEFRKVGRVAPARADHVEDESAAESVPPPPEREFWLLRFLLLDETQLAWVAQHLDLAWLQHEGVRRAVAARLEAHRQQNWHGVPGLLDQIEDPNTRRLVAEAAAAENPGAALVDQITSTVRLLRNDFLDRQLSALTVRLNQPDQPEAEYQDIEREKNRLRKLKQTPL